MKKALLILLLFLSSCGIYRSQFDCKPGSGVGCESVSTVNALVNDNVLDDYLEAQNTSEVTEYKKSCCNAKSNNHYQLSKQPTIHRQKQMKVWIKEYTDKSGVKHEAHNVYVVPKVSNKQRR